MIYVGIKTKNMNTTNKTHLDIIIQQQVIFVTESEQLCRICFYDMHNVYICSSSNSERNEMPTHATRLELWLVRKDTHVPMQDD